MTMEDLLCLAYSFISMLTHFNATDTLCEFNLHVSVGSKENMLTYIMQDYLCMT